MSALEVDANQQQQQEASKKRKLEAFFNVNDDGQQQQQPKEKKAATLMPMKCVVCWLEQGEPGMVPCILSRCRPVAHTICLACCEAQRNASGSGLVKCPTCALEGEVVPIASVVDETVDAEAKRLIDQVKFRGNASAAFSASSKLIEMTNKAVANGRMELIQKRIDYILSRTSRSLQKPDIKDKYPQGQFSAWTSASNIPVFDKRSVRLRANETNDMHPKKTTNKHIADTLRAIILELKPFLEEIYRDSLIKVTINENDQMHEKKFVYLKVHIKMF